MNNLQFNDACFPVALTRINVSRFAIVLFVALLAHWQGVGFGNVPDGWTSGPSTYTANVAEGTTETTSNLMITGGVNEIIKTGGGTWKLTRALVMNNPSIYLQEGTIDFNGNIQFSGYLVMTEGSTFISNINEHGLDKETTANDVMYNFQGSGTVVINSGKSFGASMTDGQHTEFSGVVQGEGNVFAVYSSSKTSGLSSLTLSGNNTFTGKYAVRFGTRLILTDDAINANGDIYIDDHNSVVEYNVKSGTKSLDLSNGKVITGYQSGSPVTTEGFNGKIEKSGPGTLQIYTEAYGSVKAESFVISSGRIDFQGYFSAATGNGIFVEDGAVFSPGLSDTGTIGSMIISSALNLEEGSTTLFEFGSYSENPDSRSYDTIEFDSSVYYEKIKFNTQEGALIKLAFLSGAAEDWAEKGAKYLIIADRRDPSRQDGSNIIDDDYTFLLGNYTNLFELQGVAGEGIYLVGLGKPLPEPSTWALLILGAAGLLYVRMRK